MLTIECLNFLYSSIKGNLCSSLNTSHVMWNLVTQMYNMHYYHCSANSINLFELVVLSCCRIPIFFSASGNKSNVFFFNKYSFSSFSVLLFSSFNNASIWSKKINTFEFPKIAMAYLTYAWCHVFYVFCYIVTWYLQLPYLILQIWHLNISLFFEILKFEWKRSNDKLWNILNTSSLIFWTCSISTSSFVNLICLPIPPWARAPL